MDPAALLPHEAPADLSRPEALSAQDSPADPAAPEDLEVPAALSVPEAMDSSGTCYYHSYYRNYHRNYYHKYLHSYDLIHSDSLDGLHTATAVKQTGTPVVHRIYGYRNWGFQTGPPPSDNIYNS